jgi:hypothetical protein
MLTRLTRAVRGIVVASCGLYLAVALYLRYNFEPTVAAALPEQKESAKQAEPSPGSTQVRELWWKTMRGFDYRKKSASVELRSYDGVRVKIPGFMVPLEDDAEKVREFLLVPYMGACIHTPPPPPNQIVHVRMVAGKSIPMEWYEPVWIHGVFRISAKDSMYGEAAFSLAGDSTEKYKER